MDVDKQSSSQESSSAHETPTTSDIVQPELKEEKRTLQPDKVPMETATPTATISKDVEIIESSSPKPPLAKVTSKTSSSKTSKSKKGNHGNAAGNAGKSIKKMPEYTEADEELGLKRVLDMRKCQLCCCYGDDKSSMAGRLLCCGLDEWVHVNCGLWSAEVFEDDDKLQNVQTAITRGKLMVSNLSTCH